jgi:hypothetical protein
MRTPSRIVPPFAALVVLAAAVASGTARADVTTYHNDNARTGQNLGETILSPANVNSTGFGRLFRYGVDGYVYAQPLYLSGVNIPGKGVHDVVYVATEHDTVYAFDATTQKKGLLWKTRLAVHGARPVKSREVGCDDLVPEIGITSTPVIDPVGGTIYVVAKTMERGQAKQRLHALDVATGAEKLGGPVEIAASVPGTGDGSDGTNVAFDPLREHQRAALTLSNGVVSIAWASHCDNGPYHGWVMGYDAGNLGQVSVANLTPDGGLGGVWQSGGGLAADAAGNLFAVTGNGTFDADVGGRDYGDSIVELSPGSFDVADFFTPFNQADLQAADLDLGSGGALLLPDQPGAHPHLLVASGKEGTIYLVDRDAMGHFHSGDDSQIVQVLPGAIGGSFDTPAYWNGFLYYGGTGDNLTAFELSGGSLSTSPVARSDDGFGFPGPTPVISANGNTNGIVWAIQRNDPAAVLFAFDATPDLINGRLAKLYDSTQAGRRDDAGKAVKFVPPLVAAGRVYVPAQKRVTVYGLL